MQPSPAFRFETRISNRRGDWIAKLFRVMSGLLGLLVVLQVFSGLTGAVEISYGVLAAEAIRLLISPASCGARAILPICS